MSSVLVILPLRDPNLVPKCLLQVECLPSAIEQHIVRYIIDVILNTRASDCVFYRVDFTGVRALFSVYLFLMLSTVYKRTCAMSHLTSVNWYTWLVQSVRFTTDPVFIELS